MRDMSKIDKKKKRGIKKRNMKRQKKTERIEKEKVKR